MSEEDKGFQVSDKRKAREALDDSGEKVQAAPETRAQETGPEAVKPQDARHDDTEQSSIDFISFISTLAATAYMHLGERIAPDQPEEGVNLPAAKQMIDLLDLIGKKTEGNLEKREKDAMDAILYNLRMRFIRESSGK